MSEAAKAEAQAAAADQGRLKILTNWRQGFEGTGAERYSDGKQQEGEHSPRATARLRCVRRASGVSCCS